MITSPNDSFRPRTIILAANIDSSFLLALLLLLLTVTFLTNASHLTHWISDRDGHQCHLHHVPLRGAALHSLRVA